MAAVAFTSALNRCGFNPTTRNYIRDQNIDTIAAFCEIPLDEIDKMAKVSSAWRQAPAEAGAEQVEFPYLALRKLKALRAWADFSLARGQEPAPAQFAGNTINTWMARLTELGEIKKEADNDKDIKEPAKLKDFSKPWETFEEEWLTYLGRHRNVTTGQPLTYIVRDHEDVEPEMLTETYQTIDDNLCATADLTTDQAKRDNQRVFDLLKPLVLGGDGWHHIQSYKRTKDGRGAWNALKNQANGTSAKTTRRAVSYAKIATARYNGRSRYTFDQYIAVHKKAYNDLAELEEPVPETKKVKDFLDGISDPALASAKVTVYGDNAKLSNFDLCQQFLKTVLQNSKTSSTKDEDRLSRRQVAALKKAAAKKKKAVQNEGDSDKPTR